MTCPSLAAQTQPPPSPLEPPDDTDNKLREAWDNPQSYANITKGKNILSSQPNVVEETLEQSIPRGFEEDLITLSLEDKIYLYLP